MSNTDRITLKDPIATHMCADCGKNYCYKIEQCNSRIVLDGVLHECTSRDIVPVGADY